jgi:hypothetical protein
MRIMRERQEQNRYQLPRPAPERRWRKPRPLTTLLTICALLALAHFIAIARPNHSGLNDPCNALIHYADYTKVIKLYPHQEMEAIQFIDHVLGGQPGALIQVNHDDPQQLSDIYVVGCSMHNHHPDFQLLLKQQNLVQGTVNVTQANTLSIGQQDVALPSDSDALLLPLQQNIYHEYAWQDNAFHQISFPGLYPVTSRSEAESLQSETQNSQMAPWNDPLATAEQMAQDLLHWPNTGIQGTLQDADMTDAHVLLKRQDEHLQILVSLSRLIQHDNQGLWFVTAAQTPGITLDQTRFSHPQASPITIQGSIVPTQNSIKATLYNHTLNPIPTNQSTIFTPDDNGLFSGSIAYANTIPNQPGLLLLEEIPPSGSSEQGRLFLTSIMLN